MFATNGKNPLVAATYYFNPSTLLSRSESNQNSHDVKDLPFDSSTSDFVKNNNNFDGNIEGDGFCTAPDSRKGICYDAKECVSRGGTPMGSCSSSSSSLGSLSSSGSSAAASSTGSKEGSVCCLCKFSYRIIE